MNKYFRDKSKYLYSMVVTIFFFLLPNGMYILADSLFKLKYNSVTKIAIGINFIDIGIYLIMFIIIVSFFVKKEGVKKDNTQEGYKNLIFSLFLIYLTCILTTPILFLKSNEVQTNLADNTPKLLLFLNFLNLVILPALNDELIFRAYILRKFFDSKKELIGGIIFSSVLFASVHINPMAFSYRSIIYAFILGLVLGLIYSKFGIIASIVGHVFINFIFYAQKYLGTDLNIVNYFEIGFVYWLIIAMASLSLIVLYYKGIGGYKAPLRPN